MTVFRPRSKRAQQNYKKIDGRKSRTNEEERTADEFLDRRGRAYMWMGLGECSRAAGDRRLFANNDRRCPSRGGDRQVTGDNNIILKFTRHNNVTQNSFSVDMHCSSYSATLKH